MEVKTRLHRFVANSAWFNIFLVSRVPHLNPSNSDHLPILIEVRECRPRRKKKKKRSHFEEFWLHDDECRKMVTLGWEKATGSSAFSRFCNKLNCTKNVLLEWSKSRFSNLKLEIEKTRAQLVVYYDSSFSVQPDDVTAGLEATLNDLLLQEQTFWRQRSKAFWLAEGDMNTHYFHQRATNKRRRNLIKGLFDEKRKCCSEDSEMENIVLDYFRSLFTSSNPENVESVTRVIPHVINV